MFNAFTPMFNVFRISNAHCSPLLATLGWQCLHRELKLRIQQHCGRFRRVLEKVPHHRGATLRATSARMKPARPPTSQTSSGNPPRHRHRRPHAAAFDFHGDGANNNDEWLAGTILTNPASILPITSFTLDRDTGAIIFPKVLGRHYFSRAARTSPTH